ncbi:MAG: PTS sugar transporter subunit IIC [Gemmatimonadetes bacterium]|nr:PTS sugar transporter subunit IIC [Gemmatimonadota bacterium]
MTAFHPLDLLWLALLGGWVATDSSSFAQFMVSRPIVAATLAGWIVGDPVAGASIGVMLEAFNLNVLPVGAARYPEAGPAAVVAGAVYPLAAGAPGAMLMVVAFALAWEWVAGTTVHQLRHFNVRLAAAGAVNDAGRLQLRHLAATGVDFLRGVILVLTGWVILYVVLVLLTPYWALGERMTGLLTGGLLAGLLAGSFRLLGGRARWFALGVAGGVTMLLVTG